MAGLGANDALRGIFAPVFQTVRFKREPAFVDCYYQLCGKSAVFKHRREASGSVSRKNVAVAVTAVWAGAVALKFWCSDQALDFGIHVFALGASTL